MRFRVRKVQVRKRGGSPFWYVRYWELGPNGKWKQMWRSSGSLRKADAEKLRREIERQLEAGRRPDADMPWDVFVAEFLGKHVVRKTAETRALYERCLRFFSAAAGPRRLGDVTVGMLEDYCNTRLTAGAAPATCNKELRHLRTALRWAMRREYLPRVPDFGGVFIRVDEIAPSKAWERRMSM